VRFDDEVGMWHVHDPHLVRSVLADTRAFSPANALTAHCPLSVRSLRILASAGFALPPTRANNGTPRHRVIRRAVARFFSPERVRAAEPLTRSLVVTRVAETRRRLARGDHVDLADLIARDVPALVLFDLLGLSEVGLAAVKRWSADSLELFWGRPSAAEQERLAGSAAEFYTWLRRRTTAARALPSDDLFGRLVTLGLSDAEICGVAYFLLIAGQETTSYLISTALHRLIADHVRWQSIARSPEPARPAVEEVLAAHSPVPTWRRITARDVTLGVEHITAGTPLLLTLTGAGGPSDLAFGVGGHRCLGAALARMEATVAVAATARALPDLCLSEPDPPMLELLSFRAPRRVVVRQRS